MRAVLSIHYEIHPGQPRMACYLRARKALEHQLRDAGMETFHLRPAVLTFSEAGVDHFLLSAYDGERPEDCTCHKVDCRVHNIVPGMMTQHAADNHKART